MKAYHICYHTDEDGLASAAVIYEAIKIKEKKKQLIFFHRIDYTDNLQNILADIHSGDVLYFVDYSFSNQNNKKYLKDILYNKSNKVVWIDHHNTSLDFVNEISCDDKIDKNYIDMYIDKSFCGAVLCYQYAYTIIFGNSDKKVYNTLPLYLRYVNSWDLWEFTEKDTEKFIYGVSVEERTPKNVFGKIFNFDHELEFELFNERYSKKFEKTMVSYVKKCIDDGSIIDTYNNNSYKSFIDKYGFEFFIRDELTHNIYSCFAANRKCNSKLFNSVLNKYDIVVPFAFNGEQYVYSLFKGKTGAACNDDIDCSYIAKILGTINNLGGGGHKGAAGFQTTSQILFKDCTIYINKSFFNKLFDKDKYLIYID